MSVLERFVPQSKPVATKLVQELQSILGNAKNLIVMTGAGISTESGFTF